MKIGLVATNDAHYHMPERRALHDVATAIRLKCTVAELGFQRFATAERHLKPPVEMARLFKKYSHALDNIQKIVERCQFSLAQLTYQYPIRYDGQRPMQRLKRLTWKGAAFRYPGKIPKKVIKNIKKNSSLSPASESLLFPDGA